jgi:hypothetical protein
MELTGIWLSFLDVPAQYTAEFNRWYDLDHLASHVARPDIVSGHRYVATTELRQVDGIQTSDLTSGHPSYATVYYFAGPLDFTSDEAAAVQRQTDRAIVKAGRYWLPGRPGYYKVWQLARVQSRPSVQVADAAVPYLAHQGIIVILGKAASIDRRDDALAWWQQTQSADLHDIPGVLATMEFEPGRDDDDETTILHVVLCSAPVDEVMRDLHRLRSFQRLVGRYPAHDGSYETLAVLPYQSIIPFQYDFSV